MTHFTAPLIVIAPGDPTGNAQTNGAGYVLATKIRSMGSGTTSRMVVTIPPYSTLKQLSAVPTSAFASDVSAVNVSFGNSADATHYGVIAVSAVGNLRLAPVSAATEFDAGGTIVITVSAVSTTTFTTGGVRAFISFVTVD